MQDRKHTSIFQKPLKIVLDRSNSWEFKGNFKPVETVIVDNILTYFKYKTRNRSFGAI